MKLFPSPVGELHFSITEKDAKQRPKIVSVPCRGTTFLNKDYIFDVTNNLFPSPVGELHFSIGVTYLLPNRS